MLQTCTLSLRGITRAGSNVNIRLGNRNIQSHEKHFNPSGDPATTSHTRIRDTSFISQCHLHPFDVKYPGRK